MKTSEILNILLAVVLVILSIKLVQEHKNTPSMESETSMSALEAIMTRTSIRDYSDRQLSEQQIDTLLRAAMAAPTAGNKQPWRFVVIKDKKILEEISDNFRPIQMARKAPVAIVVCGDTTATFEGQGVGYWIQDASAATENMLIAAHAMGLGAVWCGIYPLSERVETLSKLLDLPENVLPLNVVPIGYPAEDPAPKDKWHPEYILK